MAIYQAGSSLRKRARLSFARDKALWKALNEHWLEKHLRMLLTKKKPLTDEVASFVIRLLDHRKRPAGSPINLDKRIADIAVGQQIELRIRKVGRAKAIEEAAMVPGWGKSRAIRAHSLHMRLFGIKQRAGIGSEK